MSCSFFIRLNSIPKWFIKNIENRRKINPQIANMLDEVYVQVSQKGIDEVINKKHLKELYKKYCE